MNKSVMLGIDLGTSSIKVVMVDPQENQFFSASEEYQNLMPKDGWVEQEAVKWLDITKRLIKKLCLEHPEYRQRIGAIGFSGQMHGTVCLDKKGRPLRPAIIWADRRSQQQVRWINETIGFDRVAEMTGNRVYPGFMLPTCLWLMKNEPAIWAQCVHVLLPKDFLRFCFTDEKFSEPSDASSTCLFDINKRNWHEELLTLTNIDRDKLPPIINATDFAGYLHKDIAQEIGLPDAIPIFCGASDQACQAVGNGIVNPGLISSTIGTGGQIFAAINHPIIDPKHRIHLFCHAHPNRWHYLAATLAAGLSLRWLRDNILEGYSYQQMADMASLVEPGSEGLLFAPYLLGARTPHMDPEAKAIFTGISYRHQREHFIRAVMEGVVFSLRQGIELLQTLGVDFKIVIASGGAVQHDLWMHLQADIYHFPIQRVDTIEPAATGAAILAGVGVGIFDNIQHGIEQMVRFSNQFEPNNSNVNQYQDMYIKYQKLYNFVKGDSDH